MPVMQAMEQVELLQQQLLALRSAADTVGAAGNSDSQVSRSADGSHTR